jgi:adenosylcobyric acid synthase
LTEAHGTEAESGAAIAGFEMHMGETTGPDRDRPWLDLAENGGARPDGAVSADGLVRGTYVHGLFAADGFRHAFLARLRRGRNAGAAFEVGIEAALDALADHLETHLDLDRLLEIAQSR